MTKLIPLNTTPTFEPRRSEAPEEIRIEGIPQYQTWMLDTAENAKADWSQVRAGVWEATAGQTISRKGEKFEFCHILSGHVRIAEDGGEAHEFKAGDSFVLKPGFVGTWTTIETVRKIFVIAE